jgi:hypothetical protein
MSGNVQNGSSDSPLGFQLQTVSFDSSDVIDSTPLPAYSALSLGEALQYAQLIELKDAGGSILYYPRRVEFEVGDVLFLRERPQEEPVERDPSVIEESEDNSLTANGSGEEVADDTESSNETGVIVQIISLGTANYPQAITKALFRLMVNVRASVIGRSHNEPPELIDEFLLATFKVRASIVKGEWGPPEGRVVNRNVDIFVLDPAVLAQHIFEKIDGLNINLGDYKGEPVEYFGGGFEKVNLITGMKGSGKSHIAKGIISESVAAGMSAIVFDINNEYQGLPESLHFVPGQNLRFRLDRVRPQTFIDMVERVAPFAERTALPARAELPRVIRGRISDGHIPDLRFLRGQDANVIQGNAAYIQNMRASYRSSLEIVGTYHLIMTEEEAQAEDAYLNSDVPEPPDLVSLSSVLYRIEHGQGAGVIVFDIGGLQPFIQYTVVDLIIDTLKEICRRQTTAYRAGRIEVPNYPTVFFEEAHMYMEPRVINELLPLIRHYGMNVFFITNTPGALPGTVFRLMDNLLMARMLNKQDIDQVKNCGLSDSETIECFASNLREYHALLLSGIDGATKNFPLVFGVRDFGLPVSGETRSMWGAMRDTGLNEQAAEDGS